MIPSQQYLFFLARGMADFQFAVAVDGRIIVDPSFAGFADAAGRTLTIHGFKVTIDARELSHDLNPELLNWSAGPLSRTEVHELTLIPSQQYLFFLARGMADFQFALTPRGRVVLDPASAGFARASWRTLTIAGYRLTIDGRALPHDLTPELLGSTEGPLSRTTTHELTLIPSAQYVLMATRVPGVVFQFRLGPDGTITQVDSPGGLVITLSAVAVQRESAFELRRALDAARLEYDIKLLDADARAVSLERIRAWVATNPETDLPLFGSALSVQFSAERDQDRRLQELAKLRADLDAAAQRLTESLDAEAPLFGPRTSVPIALLPVRIETKWSTDRRSIKARVYPDDIHVDSFEPRLTSAELDAARKYWAAPGEPAWQDLLRVVSAPRAAWATRAARPGAATAPQLRDPRIRRAPQVTTLPHHWRFLGLVDGRVVVDQPGVAIPDPLPLGLLAADEAAPDHQHAEWAVEFDVAVGAGMAAELVLPVGFDHLDQLFVIGVSDLEPEAGAQRLGQCLQGHVFSDGFGFLPVGTPTNNTPDSRSAWSSRPTPMPPGPSPTLLKGTDAARLADALGLGDAGFLGECTGAAQDGDGAIAALSLLSWWSLVYEFQSEAVLADDDPTGAGLRDRHARWLKIRNHLADHVRSRGPLPTVRVGRQPYGVLPVTALDEWVPADPDGADALIAPWLQRLRHHWRAALTPGWVPRVTDGTPADWIAADILARLPVSNDIVIRRELTSKGGHEKFDGISLRAPGPTVALGGIRSGLRWAIPSELISNLAWTSDTTPPDYTLVPQRLAPNADKYAALFADSRRRLADAVGLLRGELTQEQFLARWPMTADGDPARPPTIFGQFTFGNPQGPTDLVPLMVNADSRDVFVTTHDGPTGDVSDLAYNIPFAVDLLISRRLSGTASEQELADQLVAARSGLPAADTLLAGLKALADVPADGYLPLAFELLDVCSHRWDAWATSLASRRLSETRAAGVRGVRLGGYGWVENLYPGTERPSDGFIHAPSLHHAATAAVLRSGFLAHRGEPATAGDGATPHNNDTLPTNGTPPADGSASPFAVDLTSRRARTARWLLGGVRRGQNLGALLGYRFERALHEAGLDPQKDAFRRAFPTPVAPEPATGTPRPDLWKHSSEAIAARNVVDGIALARAHGAGTVDTVLSGKGFPAADPGTRPLLDDLVQALDAVSDLLLAESVHQLVGGNPMRAGLAADTLGSGEQVPDRIDVLRTPHRGRAVTHRIAAVLPRDPARPAGWGTDAFSALEPRVDAWVADLLGPAADWKLSGTVADGPSPRLFAVTLDQVGFSALGLVLDVSGTVHRRLRARIRELSGAPGTEVGFDRGWDELRAVAGRIQGLLLGAGPLLPSHLLDDQAAPDPGAPAGQAVPGLEQVRSRVAEFVANVRTPDQRDALGIEGDPARLGALTADSTVPGWLGEVTRVLAEFLGTGIPLTPLLSGTALPPPADGVSGAAVADWLRRFAKVRPTVRTWYETLLLAEGRAGRASRLSASQLPADGAWIGGPFDPLTRPSARRHLVCHTAAGLPDGGPVAGMVFDEWVEVLPGADALAAERTRADGVPAESELTGVSFHFDRPDAKAPQAVLIAVPPDTTRGWTADGLALVVRDTLELAKMRAVDLADLPLMDDILPASRVSDFGPTALAAAIRQFWIDLAED
ncbi:hypothetical protein J5Y04_37210 [Kitasatospora sp. RG8]|uniref:hypothetical protein n=1 Tax=Kitasatospora sp. RG8 TaxID=2820815 RepID=UPI001AE020A5|nr:hypothetical protein [Kitasatospora sp. RG8]MBP0455116.1 hypothetical protein [Kitasatospora sp. RG8]